MNSYILLFLWQKKKIQKPSFHWVAKKQRYFWNNETESNKLNQFGRQYGKNSSEESQFYNIFIVLYIIYQMGKLCFYYFPRQKILIDYGLNAGWKKVYMIKQE